MKSGCAQDLQLLSGRVRQTVVAGDGEIEQTVLLSGAGSDVVQNQGVIARHFIGQNTDMR